MAPDGNNGRKWQPLVVQRNIYDISPDTQQNKKKPHWERSKVLQGKLMIKKI